MSMNRRMDKKSLWEFHRSSWYNAGGLAFEDIEPHIENFKRVDEIVPPAPRFYLVANLHTYRYDYVGKGQSLLTGYDNEYVSKKGIYFQLDQIHPDDADYIIKQAYPLFDKTINSFAPEERKNILMQSNYRFKHKDGHYVHLMEQIWEMKADGEGNRQLMLIHIYELPMIHPFSGNITMKKLQPDQTYQTLYSEEYPEPKKEVPLSPREKEVISLLAEGYNSEQIGERLSISYHTVSTHRKNILQKLEVKSTNELIAYGITRGIIK
jgi:DNA-binding CsgD family transcriptional regulator